MLTWASVDEKPSQGPLPTPGGLEASLGQPPFGLEHARRLDIFARNLAKAQQLQEEDLGTAEFGVTPFSDLTGTRTPSWLLGGRWGSRTFSRDTNRWTGQVSGFCFPEGL